MSSFKVLEGTLIQTKVSATKSHANNFVYYLTAPPTNPLGLHAIPATQINTEMGKLCYLLKKFRFALIVLAMKTEFNLSQKTYTAVIGMRKKFNNCVA